MALVIKSWSVKSKPATGEPYVRVVARQSGFWSFIFSLLGIDATTTLVVSNTRIEFEQGSLSGFMSRLTTFDHISSSFYGSHKPWKTALMILGACMFLGGLFKSGWAMFAMLLIGSIAGGLYYFLNRELMIGFAEDSGAQVLICFKKSIIEGQEINEEQLRKIITIVEHLIKDSGLPMPDVDMGGTPENARMAGVAPQNLGEVFKGAAPAAAVPQTVFTPAPPSTFKPALSACPKCATSVTPQDTFCGGCGYKLQ